MTTPLLQLPSLSARPYPPPIVVQHPMWYFYNTDFFLIHCGLILGLHRRIFDQSTRFHHLLAQNESGHGTPAGTTCWLPIIVDHVPLETLMGFLTLAYYP